MKIINGNEPVLKVYYDESSKFNTGKEGITIYVDPGYPIFLTPEELLQFIDILYKEFAKTDYAKGMKKNEIN